MPSIMHNTEADLDQLILEDFEFDIPCTGDLHTAGQNGHVPEQPATHYTVCPGCGLTVLFCAGRAFWLQKQEAIEHMKCGATYPTSEWTFGRIPGK